MGHNLGTLIGMEIGYIGLGKMGFNMATRLREKGYRVVAYNKSEAPTQRFEEAGGEGVYSIPDLSAALSAERIFWIMVPHHAVDAVLEDLIPHVTEGDVIIDGGNSPYAESMRRATQLAEKGTTFMDVGVSGGPEGARNGACLMVGGAKDTYDKLEPLFADLAAPDGYGYLGKSGAGHFVKMVHNGIEYGMMQAIAEGFHVMKASEFDLSLAEVARVYNHKSVIESRLVGWLEKAYREETEELTNISGEVSHSGEGQWTVETAKKLGIPVPVIEDALQFRIDSQGNPSYTGKVVSALRNQFGGHDVTQEK